MPVPLAAPRNFLTFPPPDRQQVEAARTSAWYPIFRNQTVPTEIIDLDALGERVAFLIWLRADSIFLPVGSEDIDSTNDFSDPPAETSGRRPASIETASPSGSSVSEEDAAPRYHLPRLNAAIRQAIRALGGAVFPKLNWTSPRDAAFMINQSERGPLFCTTPADVYLLIKSSDLISHDLDPARAYEGCAPKPTPAGQEAEGSIPGGVRNEGAERVDKIELVLKTFVEMNTSKEVRCFVRGNVLLGITQRDLNYYEHLQSRKTKEEISDIVQDFWEDYVREVYPGGPDYTFDLYLSSDLTTATLVDFNPYRPSTDPLLFTYQELLELYSSTHHPPHPTSASASTPNRLESDRGPEIPRLPILRVIDSRAHPDATRNAPAFASSMMPIEMLEMSQGRSVGELRLAWEEAVRMGMADEDASNDSEEAE